MNKSFSVLNNLIKKTTQEVSRFLKRDYFELVYIKNEQKIKTFYELTVNKNLPRIVNLLQNYNPNYGIIHNKKEIVKSENNLFWDIKVVDDFANFVNNISLWGININLLSIQEKTIIMTAYYMPISDEFYIASKDDGCFLNNKKLNIFQSDKNFIQTDSVSNNYRKFGSDILSIFFVAAERINIANIKCNEENKMLSMLIMQECKGKIIDNERNIKLGSNLII